jgi:geranylgeranyl pyrophosphate synthase
MNSTKKMSDSNKLIEKITGHFSEKSFQLPSVIGQTAVRDALNKSVLNGGKRIRPYLTLLFSGLAGIKDNGLKDCLSESIEFVHAASLAHDDVIDNASKRRGNPSINILIGNKKSILAGDFLLAEVINKLCGFNNMEVLSVMAQTIKDLSLGEWLQYELLTSRAYKEDSFERISLLKTSSVLKWCVVAPLIATKQSRELIELGEEFGNNLGLSFQYSDDILDFKGTSKKDVNLDLKNNQLNMVTYLYLKNKNYLDRYTSGENLLDLVNFEEIQPFVDEVERSVLKHIDISRQVFSKICSELNTSAISQEKIAINLLLSQLEKRIL